MTEAENQYDDFEDGDELEDEGDDEPVAVFVGLPGGGPLSEETFRVIGGVCERLRLDALRLRPGQTLGARGGGDEIQDLLDSCDFAILEVSQKRPTLAQEVAVLDREFDPAFIMLIAKAGSPPSPELEGREINSYADKGELRAIIERQLNSMIDAWHEDDMDGGDE